VKNIIEFSGSESHATMQAFYMSDRRIGLKPNLVVVRNGQKWFVTNSLGMKGPEPPSSGRLVPIWGDSIVFGIGSPTWIDYLNDRTEGYHFLNGGVEGCTVDEIIDRALRANARHAFHANVIFPGWHPSSPNGSVNEEVERVLLEGVKRLPRCILLSVPTALDEEMLGRDLTAYGKEEDPKKAFRGWANDLRASTLRSVYRALLERNEIIRHVAESNSIPLVDWFALMRTTARNFNVDFFDFGHPRVTAYHRIAEVLGEAITPYL
jgi:hypothetical protein